MKKAVYIKNKLTKYQKLLIMAMIITPFTALRPTFIGFGELVFIIAFLYEFRRSFRNIKLFLFTKFWLLYLLFTLLGIIYNVFFLDFQYSALEGMVFDFSSYVVVMMSCFLFEKLIYQKKINTYLFLKYVFLFFSVILSILYVISFFRHSIFGFSLIYAGIYFVPLTDNLHQISMFLTPLIFVGVLLLKVEKNKFFKLFIILLIALDVLMDFNVGSDKAILGIYTGAIILIITSIVKFFKGPSKAVFLTLVFIFLAPAIIINFNSVKRYAVDSFHENDIGNGRQILYSKAVRIGMASPLFGYGPGAHIPDINDRLWDAHQTFLAIFLQTGIFGIILFISLYIKIFVRLFNNPILFSAFIPIFIYASGGDILRKLSIWIFLILFYYYNVNDEKPYALQYIATDSLNNND